MLTKEEVIEIRSKWEDEEIRSEKQDVFDLMNKNFEKMLSSLENMMGIDPSQNRSKGEDEGGGKEEPADVVF